jgi:hypothetical protein
MGNSRRNQGCRQIWLLVNPETDRNDVGPASEGFRSESGRWGALIVSQSVGGTSREGHFLGLAGFGGLGAFALAGTIRTLSQPAS